jgi:uncharacterized membrane protein (UPF0127 family)
MMKKLILLLLFMAVGWWFTQPDAIQKIPLKITTNSGSEHQFSIELALSPSQKVTGLMHRTSLAENGGMLFLYDEPAEIGMWMKNTLIPLDIIFIDESGIITKIKENATPHSLESIVSDAPVKAALELNGGTATQLNIQKGDKVEYEIPINR